MSRLESSRSKPYQSFLFQSVLFLVGVALVFWVAPVGFLSSNQSIIFDGGWRILSGQIPFRDFTAPNAVLPSFMQTGFFAVFGVTWFAYILHSVILNGLFCIVAYRFLRCFGFGEGWSFFYGALTGIIFYPPSGLPYMEQHAFFFTLCALYFAVTLPRADTDRRLYFRSFMIVVLLFAAYFSKQVPTVIFVPIILITAFYSVDPSQRKKLLYAIITGSIICIFILAVIALVMEVDPYLLWYYGFYLPSSIGVSRFIFFFERRKVSAFLDANSTWLIALGIMIVVTGIISLWSHRLRRYYRVLIISIATILLLVGTAYLWKSAAAVLVSMIVMYDITKRRRDGAILMAGILILGSLVFTVLTNMLYENGMPLIYLAAGLIHFAFGIRARTKVVAAFLLIVPMVTAFDAGLFQARINIPRAALFISEEEFAAQPLADIREPASMRWFKGPVYRGYTYNAGDIAGLVQFLEKQDANFWIFGDASILYGLAGKPSTSPALWYHYNLAIPRPGTKEFTEYERQTLRNFERYNVKWIVIENTFTGNNCKLEDFTLINDYIRSNAIDTVDRFSVRLIALR